MKWGAWILGIELGLLSFGQAQTYVSPFSIQLDPDIASWTSDIQGRTDTLYSNTHPEPADWYLPENAPGQPGGLSTYGVEMPQLFSVATAPVTPVFLDYESNLRYDRAAPVFGVAMNATPVGVNADYFQRQRLLSVANSLIGTPYQHLHLPEFDPWGASGYDYWDGHNPATQPPGSTLWQWNQVSNTANLNSSAGLVHPGDSNYEFANPYQSAYGRGTGGIDCTDFTAYLYNVALGIQLNSGTATQIRFDGDNNPYAYILDAQGEAITPNFLKSVNYDSGAINQAGDLEPLFASLNAGDLLYIADKPGGTVLHVVVWLDQYTLLPDANGNAINAPLVISSHDNTPAIFDTLVLTQYGLPDLTALGGTYADYLPPPGVHILPMVAGNWFYDNFSVAMQVLPVPEPSSLGLVIFGLLAVLVKSKQRPSL